MEEEHYYVCGVSNVPNVGQTIVTEDGIQYVLERQIAMTKGSYVFLTTNPIDGSKQVLKCIKFRKEHEMRIQREIEIHRCLSHPNIIPISQFFRWDDYMCMTMPFATGGTLHSLVVSQRDGLPEPIARNIFLQICSGLKFLHDQNIWHRDIKLENFLIMGPSHVSSPHILFADFGFARQFQDNEKGAEFLGTIHYASPQIYKNIPYDNKTDIWSLGVCLYAMLGGVLPFPTDNAELRFNCICSGRCSFDPRHFRNISNEAKDLIQHMLTVDPDARFSIDQVLSHPWLPQKTEIESDVWKHVEEFDVNPATPY